MLPAAALTDDAAAIPLVLRAWVHEAMRTLADRVVADTRGSIIQHVRGAALHAACVFVLVRLASIETHVIVLQLYITIPFCRCKRPSANTWTRTVMLPTRRTPSFLATCCTLDTLRRNLSTWKLPTTQPLAGHCRQPYAASTVKVRRLGTK